MFVVTKIHFKGVAYTQCFLFMHAVNIADAMARWSCLISRVWLYIISQIVLSWILLQVQLAFCIVLPNSTQQ